jgi:hypothetical protein
MPHVIEKAASHFYLRAEMGKNAGRRTEEIDEDYKRASALAALAAPYRHARLSAMKLAGDPNNQVRIRDDASIEELRSDRWRPCRSGGIAGAKAWNSKSTERLE